MAANDRSRAREPSTRSGDAEKSRPRVRVGSTGGKAERFSTLPIATNPSRVRKVALWLGPDDGQPPLPDIAEGDQLSVSAEFQLTTDCHTPQSDCVMKPYDYDPEVHSQLLLTSDPALTGPVTGKALAITKLRSEKVSHAHHHHVLVYDEPFKVPKLPWLGSTFVSLVLSASSPKAGPQQILIAGQNDPGGKVEGDMATLSVVRVRGSAGKVGSQEALKKLGARSLPVIKGETRVVYSQILKDLKKGEQLAVRVALESSAGHLKYPARASVRVILGDTRADTYPGDHAKAVTAARGDISRKNGTNRLPGEHSGRSLKSGVVRMTKDATKPLFVNTVIETGDPLQQAKDGDEMSLLDGGGQRTTRYEAELDG